MAQIAPGTVLSDRYVVGRVLGGGGMGDVYEAVQRGLSRRVAIKLLKPELAKDPEMLSRFRREAEAAAALGHPNIVQVTDLCVEPGEMAYLVMEHLEGKSLDDILVAEGRLAPDRAVFIALQVLSALASAHAAQIVHRDIKPGNVFVMRTLAQDIVKLLDFGVAKLLEPQASGGPLTQVGEVLGTTSYMAPEQALGMPVDARADLFAVGALLFHALSGERAREAGDVEAAAFERIRKLGEVAPWLDARLAAVVDRSLHRDPAGRWSSALQMASELRPLLPRAGVFDETVRDHKDLFRESLAPSSTTDPMMPKPLPAPTPLMTAALPAPAATVMAPPAPLGPARTSQVPPTVIEAPLRDSRQPPPYARPSYPAPVSSDQLPRPPASAPRLTPPPAPPPPSARVGFVLGIVAAVVSALGLVVAGIYYVIETRHDALERKHAMLAGATACPRPATCTGFARLGEVVTVCAPESQSATWSAPGDVVIVQRRGIEVLGRIEDVSSGGIFSLREPNGVLTTASKSDIRGRVCR
jgi:serine/threonine-protein kinase